MNKTKCPNIAVLMSCYNGKKYIAEQIDSILLQKAVHIQLIIRDDGSNDGTQDIIKQYTGEKKVKFLQGKENLGPGLSFMTLLKENFFDSYDYYAFADQDDIWYPDKLHRAVKKLEVSNKPALYCSNQTIYKDGQKKGLRFDCIPDLSLVGHISKNMLSGCTMVFNSALAELVATRPTPPGTLLQYRMHDAMIFLIALVNGEIVYDKDSYINYRIHDTNTVGLEEKSLFSRIKRLMWYNAKNIRKNSARYLLDNYTISQEDKEILEEFANYQDSIREKYRLFSDTRFCDIAGEKRLLFRLKVLINYV